MGSLPTFKTHLKTCLFKFAYMALSFIYFYFRFKLQLSTGGPAQITGCRRVLRHGAEVIPVKEWLKEMGKIS